VVVVERRKKIRLRGGGGVFRAKWSHMVLFFVVKSILLE
jgi:hypothetical protein